MKKSFGLSIALVLLFATSVFANPVASTQKVTLDDQEVNIRGYNIDGNNYFKLRDIAAILANSEASFDVSYNEDKNSIEVTRNSNYTPLDTDLVNTEDKEIKHRQSSQKVYIDNEYTLLNAYFINDNNYFKLRDLGKTIGFYVDFDEKSNTIVVKSQKTDPTDLIEREVVSYKAFETLTKPEHLKYTFANKKNLTANDFISQIETVILLSKDERQFSAKATYNKEKNTVELTPLLFKIKSKLYFDPYIRVEQNNKREFFEFKENISVDELIKDFSKDEDLQITMGYFIENTEPQNYRGVSTIDFSK